MIFLTKFLSKKLCDIQEIQDVVVNFIMRSGIYLAKSQRARIFSFICLTIFFLYRCTSHETGAEHGQESVQAYTYIYIYIFYMIKFVF